MRGGPVVEALERRTLLSANVMPGRAMPTVLSVASGVSEPAAYATVRMASGWYYPLNRVEASDTYWGYYGDSKQNPQTPYLKDQAHVGADLPDIAGTPVYAVGNGIVIAPLRTGHGAGDNNYALFIRHYSADGDFVAVYGHVRTKLHVGDIVNAGEQVATVGPYIVNGKRAGGDHLHFGVHPGKSAPNFGKTFGWGAVGMNDFLKNGFTNGFVAPIAWLKAHLPASDSLADAQALISRISPTQPVADNQRHTLTISGSNFPPNAIVNLYDLTQNVSYPNRTVVAPHSDTVLTLTANFGTTAGQWVLEVVDPVTGNKASIDFNVVLPPLGDQPSISGTNPNPVIANDAAQVLTITGTNFKRGGNVKLHDETDGGDYTVGPLAQIPLQRLGLAACSATRVNGRLRL